VRVLSISFSEFIKGKIFLFYFSPLTFCLFSELPQAYSSITFALSQTNNQISVFNSKYHCCRTDLHDARTMSSIPKNIYSAIR